MKKLITIILFAVLLIAATPQGVSEQTAQSKIEQSVIYSAGGIDLRVAKRQTIQGPEYRVVGMLLECDSTYDVQALVIGNPTDSVHTQGVPVARQFVRADSCQIEMYAFGVHGGAVRRVLEADGLAEFVVICANGAIQFKLTAEGEADLIKFFARSKEESI